MDDMEILKKLAQCEDKEQMQRVIEAHNANQKPQTNADRIRSMSDEELAKGLSENCKGMKTCAICPLDGKSCAESEAVSDWLEWLKQPADMRG